MFIALLLVGALDVGDGDRVGDGGAKEGGKNKSGLHFDDWVSKTRRRVGKKKSSEWFRRLERVES